MSGTTETGGCDDRSRASRKGFRIKFKGGSGLNHTANHKAANNSILLNNKGESQETKTTIDSEAQRTNRGKT
jgi:hypothetical protein